ncbi:MAG: DNA mismatch repair endonuclease MutL [Chloroflexota bacterium]|nr:MAG: DNA mismatch repair endonuclease MutL [Chloroflexota bacterium]
MPRHRNAARDTRGARDRPSGSHLLVCRVSASGRIEPLPRDVAEKVAAGEVIQRPADVVKELVENAIDAIVARRINEPEASSARTGNVIVDISGGGLESIRVVDDGGGIAPDQLAIALARHATSKLRTLDDLADVVTLGFRGEALPSIAAVAAIALVSRVPGGDAGAFVEAEDGAVLGSGARGSPIGTQVTVRRLFATVPARLAFQRSPGGEAAAIARLIGTYALAYPEIRFRLTSDRRIAIATDGSGDRRATLAAIHGADVALALLPFEALDPAGVRVSGVMSAPELTRGTRSEMYLYVNRRPIQNRALGHAIIEAYRGFTPDGRFPMVVVDIEVDPREIDVNVHPSKMEVRFRRDRLVYGAVQRAVRGTLVTTAPPPSISAPLRAPPAWLAAMAPGALTATPYEPRLPFPAALAGPSPLAASAPASPVGIAEPVAPTTTGTRLPVMRILGQAHGTYIVCEGPDGIYFVDQHAAHERVLYEQVLARRGGDADRQALLEPLVIDLPAERVPIVLERRSELLDLGFDIEPFGDCAAIIRSVPAAVASRPRLREAIVSAIEAVADPTAAGDPFDRAAASVACHAAVRAGDTLSFDLMRDLIGQLEGADLSAFCPHGRPTVVRLPASQLERDFGRR